MLLCDAWHDAFQVYRLTKPVRTRATGYNLLGRLSSTSSPFSLYQAKYTSYFQLPVIKLVVVGVFEWFVWRRNESEGKNKQ